MTYRGFCIYVEGPDDERFFNNIIKPKLLETYDSVKIICHVGMTDKKIKGYIKSIKSMNCSYIFVKDIDTTPCVTAKKQQIKNRLQNIDEDKVVVVIPEIESWYLAGLDHQASRKLRIKNITTTDEIDKEGFKRLTSRKFESQIDCMSEILKSFSIQTAIQKNKSFRYFIRHLIAEHNCVIPMG